MNRCYINIGKMSLKLDPVKKERRDFIKKTGKFALAATAATAATAAFTACGDKESKQDVKKAATGKTYEWKMVTTWPPNLPVLQTGAERFAKRVEEATAGRIKIKVFAGKELVGAMGVFDAVSDGWPGC